MKKIIIFIVILILVSCSIFVVFLKFKKNDVICSEFTPRGSEIYLPDALCSNGCDKFNSIFKKYKNLSNKICLYSKTQKEADELWRRELLLASQNADFRNLEQDASKDNKCKGQGLYFLLNVYSQLNLTAKAGEAKKLLLDYADKGNFSAITVLCLGYNDKLLSRGSEIKYCENVVESKDINNSDTIKNLAYKNLIWNYKDDSKIITLCKKLSNIVSSDVNNSFISSKNECFFKMENIFASFAFAEDKNQAVKKEYEQMLDTCKQSNASNDFEFCNNIRKYYGLSLSIQADSLFESKNYVLALNLYKEAADYDNSGHSFAMIASMYNDGEEGIDQDSENAIYWYKRALDQMEKNNMLGLYDITVYDMGIAYEKLQNYKAAFDCYHRSAVEGNAESQFALARMYVYGRGVIQDYVQAFAWISVATAQGLQGKDNQLDAEQIKLFLHNMLVKTYELSEGEMLAKKYYSIYVLHEKPTNDSLLQLNDQNNQKTKYDFSEFTPTNNKL